MHSRLQQVRQTLRDRNADLQRLYKFNFKSVKLALFNIDIYILSINHPQYQFNNFGDYKGLIDSVIKPNEMSITFLEDTEQTVNSIFNIWDGLKFNKWTGIHYPKAVYEDIAWLRYLGEHQKEGEAGGLFGTVHIESGPKQRTYALTGFYPINRESISLSYDNNAVEVLSVTFNVDSINPLFIPAISVGGGKVRAGVKGTIGF